MDIISAINDLRDELEAGTAADTAIRYTASEYGIKPEVLRIRFEKAFGTPPEIYAPKKSVSAADLVQAAIDAEAKKWRFSHRGEAALGTKFFSHGEWWHLIAYTGTKIHAVRADTAKVWEFSGPRNIGNILSQIEKKMAA